VNVLLFVELYRALGDTRYREQRTEKNEKREMRREKIVV